MNSDQIIRLIVETKSFINEINTNDEKFLPLLLNSLLSLVILPTEEIKRKPREKIFGQNLGKFYKAIGTAPTIFNPIKSYINGKVLCYKRTPQKLVEKLRNGVAHQNIDIHVFEGITYVVIYNVYFKDKFKERDFEIKLSIIELKKLALYIANCYLSIGV